MRHAASTVFVVFFLIGPAHAEFDDWRDQRRTLMEMDQVNRGDYTYQITPDARIIPRCDRAANRIRRTRDPNLLRFPEPCGREADHRRRRRH